MFRIAHAPQPAVWSADKKREPVPVACDAELSVSKRNWLKITRGHNVTIRGRGYYYEGDFLWDYWHFSGALDGKLTVSVRIAEERRLQWRRLHRRQNRDAFNDHAESN